jgi:hypothetical protein
MGPITNAIVVCHNMPEPDMLSFMKKPLKYDFVCEERL